MSLALQELQPRVPSLTEPDLVHVLWALARVGQPPPQPALWAGMLGVAARLAPSMSTRVGAWGGGRGREAAGGVQHGAATSLVLQHGQSCPWRPAPFQNLTPQQPAATEPCAPR